MNPRTMSLLLTALTAAACSPSHDRARTTPDDMVAVARLMVTLEMNPDASLVVWRAVFNSNAPPPRLRPGEAWHRLANWISAAR